MSEQTDLGHKLASVVQNCRAVVFRVPEFILRTNYYGL